jgi:hypothetical protein
VFPIWTVMGDAHRHADQNDKQLLKKHRRITKPWKNVYVTPSCYSHVNKFNLSMSVTRGFRYHLPEISAHCSWSPIDVIFVAHMPFVRSVVDFTFLLLFKVQILNAMSHYPADVTYLSCGLSLVIFILFLRWYSSFSSLSASLWPMLFATVRPSMIFSLYPCHLFAWLWTSLLSFILSTSWHHLACTYATKLSVHCGCGYDCFPYVLCLPRIDS